MNGWRLRRSGHANFPCHGGGAAVPPSSFIQAAFPSTIQVLCYFPCTPRATALRQARVSGGNLQNCAPSAACGGAMTEESNVSLRPPLPSSPVPFWEPPRALAKQLKHFCAFMQCFIARKLHFIHTLGIIYGEKLWITWTTKWG